MQENKKFEEKYMPIFFLFFTFIIVSLCELDSFSLSTFNSSPKIEVKSIYAGVNCNYEKIMTTLKAYGANAVVIDVKDDMSRIASDLKISPDDKKQFIKINNTSRDSLKELVKKLKNNGVYLIARVVAFKEFVRKDLCIKDENGALFIDKEKTSWMHPSDEKAQKYLEEICTKAIKIGFDEIQLDYVRFSTYTKIADGDLSRIEIINNFIKRICDSVHKLGGKVSVCVFGCTIEGSVDTKNKRGDTAKSSAILGQNYIDISTIADFICPMIYPSHFPTGSPCDIENPDLEPYNVIINCVKLSDKMLKNKKVKAIVRPYLQAFTASWLKIYKPYKKAEIEEQIKAIYDSGLTQWGLFNMSGKYPLD